RLHSQHALQRGAVLGAVQASSLRADRCAASGLDRASAQLGYRAVACRLEGVWTIAKKCDLVTRSDAGSIPAAAETSLCCLGVGLYRGCLPARSTLVGDEPPFPARARRTSRSTKPDR